MLIYFLENSIPFNATDINSPKIAGTEKTLINIANELAKNTNLSIKVFNKTISQSILNNVEWNNINNVKNYPKPDILIAFSDANLFQNHQAKKKYLWSHSVQNFEKFIRKKQFLPFYKHKPIMLLESMYHYKTRSLITSLFGKKIINLAADYEFINENIDINFIPEKKAIFTTRPDRNIEFLLSCWVEINKISKESQLFINPPFNLSNSHKKIGIKLRNKGEKKILINDLKNSRIMLNPGHRGEVFCLSAIEAQELCIPIVTMGYGSLAERVEHSKTGYIAKNKNEFIKYSVELLENDKTYLEFKKNLIDRRGKRTYKNVSEDLLKIIS